MKKATVFASVIVALIVCLFLLRRSATDAPQSAPQDASVLFAGFTNIVGKGRCAVFSLTNRTDKNFVCTPEAIEQLTSGSWLRTPLTDKAMWRASQQWGLQEELKPNQAFTFYVPSPVTNYEWRVVLRLQERSAIVDAGADLVRQVSATNAAIAQSRQFSGRRFSLTTPNVNE